MPYQLGRVVRHDPRSRQYAAPEPPVSSEVRDVEWPRLSPILDQGDLGSCTGNAMAGWLGCAPHATSADEAQQFDEALAVESVRLATELDDFAGVYPPDDTGSSGLAVAKAAQQLGHISGYTWAFSTSALLHALQSGPVIMGVSWYSDMFEPDSDNRVWATGDIAGGHEILVRGISGTDLLCDNSWGTSWGNAGSFRLPLETWETLRDQQADVTIPQV